MTSRSQRSYTDLIYHVCSKWVNWNPRNEIKVGTYGTFDEDTRNFLVEGNIYDSEFQEELDKHGIKIKVSEHLPEQGPAEEDFIISWNIADLSELNQGNKDLGTSGISTTSQLSVESSGPAAIFIMNSPRLTSLPEKNLPVLEHLHKIDKLKGKWVITVTHSCPAYCMYFSEQVDDKVSLTFVTPLPFAGISKATTGAGGRDGGFGWWADTKGGVLRKANNPMGTYSFTPLFSAKRTDDLFW